jgi:branched-chain amino acid aminotransferase
MKTDGHVEYSCTDGEWNKGSIVDDDHINISVSSTCLHYGQECFEGLKGFETKDGRVLVFRPDENAKRMIRTAEKIHMAPPPEDMFLEGIDRVVRQNKRYIPPHGSGASLYIRPLLIGVSGFIGVRPSNDYLWLAFACPVGPYFKGGLTPIKLMIMEDFDRAAPDGLGDAKTGGNYAAGLRGMLLAREQGFAEALYVDPSNKQYIEETGASNFFGITKDGKYVTPESRSILPSITNKSLMQVAEDLGMGVERRPIHVEELFEFAEVGAVGTAAVITPIHAIQYRDKLIEYTDDDTVGPVSKKLYDTLTGIQAGDIEDKHGWNREIDID